MTIKKQHWDIFCRVIDNYGDIGVCWRLARQLAVEYPFQVRLWVDDIQALTAIWPSATTAAQQLLAGIEVCVWPTEFDDATIAADVVLEAFACHLPDSYLQNMKHKNTQPQWFNLEYLSAEDWVEGCHALTSTHPQRGLKKTFFFPGFTTKTGGLLREQHLFAERDNFQNDADQIIDFFHSIKVAPKAEDFIISLFGYENEAMGSLLDAWAQSNRPILCLIPAGRILVSISSHIGQELVAGSEYQHGALRLRVIPLLTQLQYDRLLWACDLNFVRGEDSFVRAQWAAKPFIWHIYPQDDDVHILKLNAFLAHYSQSLPSHFNSELTDLWRHWNQGLNCADAWNSCLQEHQLWLEHTQKWTAHLNTMNDLSSNLVRFCHKAS